MSKGFYVEQNRDKEGKATVPPEFGVFNADGALVAGPFATAKEAEQACDELNNPGPGASPPPLGGSSGPKM